VSAEPGWLTTMWPKVQSHLPPPPAQVIEIGCGKLGGFVPSLRESGYDALGIDPVAPMGDQYRQSEFERCGLPGQAEVIVACTSLHHVAEPRQVIERIASTLTRSGVVIVVEWDWEGFDEATARWCFERLAASDTESWLHRRRENWIASGQPWDPYFRGWAQQHGLNSARQLVRDLDEHFERRTCGRGPFFFAELAGTDEDDELVAINSGQIQPGRIDYVGQLG
jgi:SAM-dependent methyltransferase